MKTAIIATLLTGASAFAPASFNGRPSTLIREEAAVAEEAPETEEVEEDAGPTYVASTALPFLERPGNLGEGLAGDAGFDPFRFSDFVPIDFLREAELKHGRICQLAIVGFAAVDCGYRIFPLPEAYEGLTSVTAHDALVEYGAMGQLFLWIGLMESLSSVAIWQMLSGSGREPGDFGLDPVGFLKGDAASVADMKEKEITHCRLAMVAFSGMVTQAVLTQGPFPYV